MRRRLRSYQASRGGNGPASAGHARLADAAIPSASAAAASGASAASGGSAPAAGSTILGNAHVHLDLNASALSVDATGAVAVLAGRKGLHLVDLEAPLLPPASLHHQTKLEVPVVQCNPHALFKSHVASSSNRNTLIWDIADVRVGASAIGSGQGAAGGGGGSQAAAQPLVATLRAHTRPVSDVAWSPMEPSLLATCSADAKTLLWDMRSPQRPVTTLNAFNTSVIQVEWNRVDATSLATAHDGEVRVWDLRAAGERTVAPAAQITAHMQKIYGLDWHPQRMYELLTCSDDKTVKFWDVTQPRVCQGTLNTGAPVWRAQYTPFGDGMVTISSQRMDNSIRLWALSHGDGDSGGNDDAGDVNISGANAGSYVTAELVHSFSGHSDLVRGMAWRVRPQTSMYQLVSWSKDQELRMWHVDVPQLEACGYDTASYLADVAPSEGNNTSARQQLDARRLLHAEFAEMHAQHSKYSLSALKTDFVPLVVPKTAVPLGTDEYTLEGNDSSLQALLALEEELIKGGEAQAQASNDEDDGPVSGTGDKDDAQSDDSASTKERAASTGGARALPCPRISGAAFSGPNMLLVFDSRVAIGQSRSSAVVPTAVAAGKGSKPQPPPNKLPRTYEELLDLRDSRFATKKNKKPPVKLLSSANIMGTMDVGANDWAGQQQQSQELIDGGVMVYGDDADNHSVSAHGYRHASMYYSSGSGGASGNDDMLAGVNEMEPSIHGGSGYLNTYFSSAEYHLPVNNPEHLLSMPTSTAAGLQLSPRASMRANTSERMNRVEQPTPALNLDLSISVTILDLSKLCGVSSILTYQTDLVPRSVTPPAVSPKTTKPPRRKKAQLGNVNRSMISWMLRAAEDMPGKRGGASKNNLSRVLQGMLADSGAATKGENEDDDPLFDESCTALAATCAQNARTALLAGRSDLQQIWSLLEISAAPEVELPIYKKNANSSSSLCLRTSHPWSAHPLGKSLVHKVLDMYEQAGDVQALASIVCALKPNERKDPEEVRDSMSPSAITMEDQLPVVREDRRSSIEEVGNGMGTSMTGTTASTSSGVRSRRSSSNALTQLASADPSDAPPVMRGARRSSSHSESRSQGLFIDKDAALRASKDWPLVSSGTNSATSSRQSSPIREHALPTNSSSSGVISINREIQSKASAPTGSTGWKMDFERLENPFKTWSGNPSKEAPPPRLTADTFQPPIQAVNGKSPAPSMTVTASPRVDPVMPSPLHTSLGTTNREEEIDANDRVLLQLSFRSVDDEKCLLSLLPEDEARYDVYKEAYADVLYRYGAMNLRNEVLKSKAHGVQDQRGISMGLRFIKGKAQRSKSDAKSKKKVIIHKAQRRRQYEKVKKREGSAAAGGDGDGDADAGSSFYDRFFSELKSGKVDEDAEQVRRWLCTEL
ncbi:unnamed protein product [Phytophthora fragariaefolia]|uniref:Unnamed protein product n=1 Tax=Phytophthora fragariaefolia TaxID=1490495 RepID=A0A9W6Y359_9STRA|nr:unnamed protein product [Phytophthora fragariaefolia]